MTMLVSEKAGASALALGAFLMAGETGGVISEGDVIEVAGWRGQGLRVVRTEQMRLIDAPVNLLAELCKISDDGFRPHYCSTRFDSVQQAAMAQMLNDAGEGFDMGDMLDWGCLDAQVSVVTVSQAVTNAH